MLSPAYQAGIDELDAKERQKAALLFFEVYWAYNKVRNQVLASIREQLEKSSKPLDGAIKNIDKAIADIKKTSQFISEVSGILDELKKLLSFLA